MLVKAPEISGGAFPLSVLDRGVVQHLFISQVLFFPAHIDACLLTRALELSLSKYPMVSGRLVAFSSPGLNLYVDQCNAGVVMDVRHRRKWKMSDFQPCEMDSEMRSKPAKRPIQTLLNVTGTFLMPGFVARFDPLYGSAEKRLSRWERIKTWFVNHLVFRGGKPLLSLRVTFLGDGTTAVGVYVTHVLMDGNSLSMFMTDFYDIAHCLSTKQHQKLEAILKTPVSAGSDAIDKILTREDKVPIDPEQHCTDQLHEETSRRAGLDLLWSMLSVRSRIEYLTIPADTLQCIRRLVFEEASDCPNVEKRVSRLTKLDIIQARLWKHLALETLKHKGYRHVSLVPAVDIRTRIMSNEPLSAGQIVLGNMILNPRVDLPVQETFPTSETKESAPLLKTAYASSLIDQITDMPILTIAEHIHDRMSPAHLLPSIKHNLDFLDARQNSLFVVFPRKETRVNGYEFVDVTTTSWRGFDYMSPVLERRLLSSHLLHNLTLTDQPTDENNPPSTPDRHQGRRRDRGIQVGSLRPVWFWGTIGPMSFPRLFIFFNRYDESGREEMHLQIRVQKGRRWDLDAIRRAVLLV